MSVEANKAAMRRFIDEMINGQDMSLVDQLLADDFTLFFPGMPPSDREGFRQLVPTFFVAFPDLRIEIDEFVGEGDSVAARFHWTGTHKGEFMGVPASGKSAALTGMGFYRFRDGKIVEDRVNEDFLGLMGQMNGT